MVDLKGFYRNYVQFYKCLLWYLTVFRAKKGTAEPFLTLGYDEWICVLEGKILFEQGDEKPDVTATAGQTVFIREGTRFRYTTPFWIDGYT